VKDQSKYRIALIHQRFGRKSDPSETAAETFENAFVRVRDQVIRPVMEELVAELRGLGHAPRISLEAVDHEGRTCQPAISLALGIRGAVDDRNRIVFAVIRWRIGGKPNDDPEVLAFHQKDRVPFDLFRYMRPDEITADNVEQLLVDSTESLFAQNAR
jgi:hypothetical protein